MPYFRKRRAYTKKRYGKRKGYRRPSMARKTLIKTIKRVALKNCELKFKDTAIGKQELYHNTVSYINLNQSGYMPAAGGSQNQRIGDQINLVGFKYRMLIGQKGDRPNVNFRWWVMKVPKGSGYAYANWWRATTSNVMIDSVNTDFCKVLKSGYWRPNEAGLTATGDDEYTFVKSLYVPYKRLLKFGPATDAVTHNDDDIYFVIAPYDAYGSITGTDNIGYYQAVLTHYYRDP